MWITILIIISLILFTIGQIIEKGESKTGEKSEEREEISESEGGKIEGAEKTFLGIDLESPLMIALFVL